MTGFQSESASHGARRSKKKGYRGKNKADWVHQHNADASGEKGGEVGSVFHKVSNLDVSRRRAMDKDSSDGKQVVPPDVLGQ